MRSQTFTKSGDNAQNRSVLAPQTRCRIETALSGSEVLGVPLRKVQPPPQVRSLCTHVSMYDSEVKCACGVRGSVTA
jgi:hypothetical protein